MWCAVALNLSPAFGITTGSWVLPDGPLMAALAGALLCILQALEANGRRAWLLWAMAGLCAGLAMLSKYSAALPMAGFLGYLLTSPRHRFWLRRAEPYAAGVLALLLFCPVLLWNAHHHWASFIFQGTRAGAGTFRLFAPLTVLGGEVLFLLPWIGIPLLVLFLRGFRVGSQDWRGWLFTWLAAPAVLFFPIVALWSADRVLFHWAAPGFLMLFPVLGMELARMRRPGGRVLFGVATGTAILLVMSAGVTERGAVELVAGFGENFAIGQDPDIQAVDWTSLRPEIMQFTRQHPGLVVAAIRWHECGKLDYSLGRQVPFLCLAKDPREFGEWGQPAAYMGRDMLIVSPRTSLHAVADSLGSDFGSVEPLPPAMLLHAGCPAMKVPLFLAHGFRGKAS